MANKLKYFVGNWKMFGNQDSISILYRINKFLVKKKYNRKNNKVIFCVPNTLIYNFSNKLKNRSISIGAQNCHQSKTFAAYTGSVNASMLKKSGANYIILGHSENRNQGESNKIIKEKIESALNQKLKIIFCIGESLSEKNKKKTFNVLRNQMRNSLSKNFDYKKIIIAYEPVWSIGTGKTPKLSDLKKTLKFIKLEFQKIFNKHVSLKILYGGSVNHNNAKLFSTINEIDGFLVGGASQSSKKFIDIINNYYKEH